MENENKKEVTKDNFHSRLIEFKDLLNDNEFKYIIINNEISTTNLKILEKEGEIVFSEFTICKSITKNSEKKKFITFLIPSIKFHRYSQDELVSFNSTFLNYLYKEDNIYNIKNIFSAKSLSYENINKKERLENFLNSVLKDGKPFKQENEKSYNYFPKAVEIPSKQFQKRFEEIIKYFIEQSFDEKINEKNENFYKYESNYKLVIRLLDFNWHISLFEILDKEKFNLVVDEYKIDYLTDTNKLRSDFISFIEELIKFFNEKGNQDNKENNIKEFSVDKKHQDFNVTLIENWKQFLKLENNTIELEYEPFKDDEKKKIKFKLMADKANEEDEFENIIKFLNFILLVKTEHNKKEYVLKNIYYKKFNMRNLFPNKVNKYIKFSYHITSKISYKFKLNKKKEHYIAKVNYKNLLMKNKNQEEILFKYNIKPYFEKLFYIKDKKKENNEDKKEDDYEEIQMKKEVEIQKNVIKEFAQDLDMLLNEKKFKKEINIYFSKLDIAKYDPSKDEKVLIKCTAIRIPDFNNDEFKKYFDSLIDLAKEIKKKKLIKEEIGVTYFYKYIFEKPNINIYGTNLKNKIIFPLKQLLLNHDENEEKQIKEILNKIDFYDIAHICKKEKINFYNKYLNIKYDSNNKGIPITQILGKIIEEEKILKNKDKLKEYKNKFYSDEKEKAENKLYFNIEKDKFYKNSKEIIDILKKKTDFTINENSDNNKMLQINFIDPENFKEIDSICKEINNIIK